ncbi:MAG: glycosyltransferase family 2 protein [Chitinophagaceae bacterium]
MSAVKVIFCISLVIIFYSYFGYGILVFFLVGCKKLFFKRKLLSEDSFQPLVALIIPAYNEEDFISAKIKNTLELDYPRQKLSVIFVTDGSTDGTPGIIRKFPFFTLLHMPERKGKLAAMNRAMEIVTEPVVVFCDANNLLNKECIKEIAKHYADPSVGGVAGEKKIYVQDNNTLSSSEGLYWQYESLLKKLDSELYSVVGAAGELLSIRTSLYEAIPENTIIEDFVLSLHVCLKGYIIRYEPNAYATETSSLSVKDEQERKVRISAGAFQAMAMLKPLFNVFRYPMLSFQFISHRVLRWTLSPVCLILVFLSNSLLVIYSESIWFRLLFFLQITFYVLAIAGWNLAAGRTKNRLLQIPYYFVFMNLAVFMGLFRIITKKQSVVWQKVNRQKMA